MPGAEERSGWLADPAPGMWPLHKGALLVPVGRAGHAQAGLADGKGAGGGRTREGGSSRQGLDCSHRETDLPRAGPTHQKERHMSIAGQEREKLHADGARSCPST